MRAFRRKEGAVFYQLKIKDGLKATVPETMKYYQY